jgi:hypothetical protein
LQLLQYARGEKLYQHDLNIKAVVDYGLSMDAILSGKERIPPQGAGFDVAVEGRSTGQLSDESAASITSGHALIGG